MKVSALSILYTLKNFIVTIACHFRLGILKKPRILRVETNIVKIIYFIEEKLILRSLLDQQNNLKTVNPVSTLFPKVAHILQFQISGRHRQFVQFVFY